MQEDDGRGTITIITITSTFSPPTGVGNYIFSTFALCLLRDAEKEDHKHKVLWEKSKLSVCFDETDRLITPYFH